MARRRWLVLFTCTLPIACAALACGSDDSTAAAPDDSQSGSEASTPTADASSDVVHVEDGGPSSDGGADARDGAVAPRPPPGSYMGYCTGDGGNSCDPGLTCLHEFMGKDGGFGGCAQAFCTHACDAGCGAPAIGCNDDFNLCEAASCLGP